MYFKVITPSGEELDANLFNVVAYATDQRGAPKGEALWETELVSALQGYYGDEHPDDEDQ